ncbi:DNA-binding protein [Nonomuraea sp. 3-1Str]|uniref:DNA-binding protein n=1 Tax=Nonomuraea sp. 3-1Str TaxID=2929801 RepID=UPI002857EE39|nr:DNA-binding protein [Nonomuraea sp. 3-1Str]MDR8408120.1 DNA-binding protein [Nonomuraea sp. 3-1Str]
MARRGLMRQGTLVLDCEGLSGFVNDQPPVVALVAEARSRGMEVVTSSLTLVEATHRRTNQARLAWLLSGMRIVHVGEEEARAASTMLVAAGLHGHKYAIDAVVAEMAVRQQRPVVMLTSDIDDMARFCGDRVRLVAV